ncbi:MAG: hypothetical protein NZ961_04365, partial [Candidatus Poribacteria bacterium]|nr:hypothetical protein [Candidatus Poribacteria bacterium]
MAEYYNGLTYRLELDFNIFSKKEDPRSIEFLPKTHSLTRFWVHYALPAFSSSVKSLAVTVT